MTPENKVKVPDDLQLKVGTKEEAFWTGVKNKVEEDTMQAKRQIEINNVTLAFAKTRIKEEESKHLNTS